MIAWRRKTAQFLHGQDTYQTCHPFSVFWILWISAHNSLFHNNVAQPVKAFDMAQSTTKSTLRKGIALCGANGGHMTFWLAVRTCPAPQEPHCSKTAHLRAPFCYGQSMPPLLQKSQSKQRPGEWLDFLDKAPVLTDKDLWKIFEWNRPFLYIEKSHCFWAERLKNGSKIKSFLLSVFICVWMPTSEIVTAPLSLSVFPWWLYCHDPSSSYCSLLLAADSIPLFIAECICCFCSIYVFP